MGASGQGGGDTVGGGSLTGTAARVVPNVPTFSVDAGFWYSIPGHLKLQVGSQVRVPLSGRKVRGWVVEISDRPVAGLKDVAGVSGSGPVFDGPLMRSLEWAARHYVAPLAVVLAKAAPPNLPKRTDPPAGSLSPNPPALPPGPLAALAADSAVGKRNPTTAVIGAWQGMDWLGGLHPVMAASRSVLVVAATATEVAEIGSQAREHFGSMVSILSVDDAAAVTNAWEDSQTPGRLLVGTPRTALWSVQGLSLTVVLEEGRRAMKDRQTPTIHVRDMFRTRSLIEGFNLAFFGPTPSVELLAAGCSVVRAPGRPWGLVEVIDRSDESPGGGLLSEQVVAALKATSARTGEAAFIYTGHKMAERLAEEVNARVGKGSAAVMPDRAPILVGSERDLPGLPLASLVVVPDVDFLLGGTGYRASEEALRQLARLGNMLSAGSGRRMMIQTRNPAADLIGALRRADPVPYLESVLAERARNGFPPSVEMLAIELRDSIPEGAEDEVGDLLGVEVLGPMDIEGGKRWLITGDLSRVRVELRSLAGRWRERGATVRIDADPIDF